MARKPKAKHTPRPSKRRKSVNKALVGRRIRHLDGAASWKFLD